MVHRRKKHMVQKNKRNKIMIGIPMYISSYEKIHVSMVEVDEVSQ